MLETTTKLKVPSRIADTRDEELIDEIQKENLGINLPLVAEAYYKKGVENSMFPSDNQQNSEEENVSFDCVEAISREE
ncbi:hypothetical protein M9H77_31504 [Catharanthus roseus]|uniref:Uncharacterized protein n=1 Tax=Catharanthus roseus TaxID=4058 RepID=A0ACC0A2Z5_CATRO|nr:hypothetical protein M9H77_31504 [Catharanthus roseus]